jgi:glycosyltransferase involved in cell wall biosynthesis
VSIGAKPLCVHLLGDTADAGAENQCRYLLAGLRDAGEYDLELAYFGAGRAHSLYEDLGLPLLRVPRLRRFRFDGYGRARRLRRAYAPRPPDLLHTWLPESNVVGLLAARGWPQARVVISQRGSWMELAYPWMLRLQRVLLERADHAISNSEGGAEMLVGFGLPRERISVIPNGIPADRVRVERERGEVRQRMGWDDHEVVAWVGRGDDRVAARQKDFGTLFAAIESLWRVRPAVRLVMIGPTADEIAARGFGLPDCASALGWQSRPAELLNAADALVISSRIEGNSNVAGEALSLGLPVVTTDCGDHCEVVRRGNGRVVEVGEATALAEAIAELLDDPPDRDEIVAAAADALSVERMVSSHLELYSRLLGGRKP